MMRVINYLLLVFEYTSVWRKKILYSEAFQIFFPLIFNIPYFLLFSFFLSFEVFEITQESKMMDGLAGAYLLFDVH